ncbi:MAG: phosphoenolpyruvate--protein phosphotransferase [Vicinamibacteraceae bacterium]|nr:phosphoenolpyruvate--protein phosphotransferase [Vicinamibacteraceae bacterium]
MAGSQTTLILRAPVSGRLVALEQVPDPVFAQKMVGDGVSIDPLASRVVAPCDGRIVHVHAAAHAVTLSTSGIEVLIHVGLDTVRLHGAGFRAHVVAGQAVRTGDLLIEFDADHVATHARSLLTEVVVTNMERVSALRVREGRVEAAHDAVLEADLIAEAATPAAAAGEQAAADVQIVNATGLHARPAATLASIAKRYRAQVRLERNGQSANAKSVVGLMGLDVSHGDTVRVTASGPDAPAAIEAVVAAIREGLGEAATPPRPTTTAPSAVPSAAASPAAAPIPPTDAGGSPGTLPDVLAGVAASPGLAVGSVVQVRHETIQVPELADDPDSERRALETAMAQARAQVQALQARLQEGADPAKAAIFAAHAELLEDPDLLEPATHAIHLGKSAAFAWQQAVEAQAARLAGLNNELLAARANDLRDIGRRVLRVLTGTESGPRSYPSNTILVAEDLTPSDTAGLDRTHVLGFCTTGGGATSHVAILARSLDIPAVAGIDPRALDIAEGTPVVLDGGKGTLRLRPDDEEVARIRTSQARQAARRRAALAAAHEPAVTRDGVRIEVVANIGGLADARQVVELGGEGVGLLRTEFLFLDRPSAPTETEQADTYAAIAEVLGPDRPLIIRTLDVGGDKPVAYLPMGEEENPFLGERGIRLLLNRPDVFRAQVRAILRASRAGRVLMMFPMIATVGEWRAARAVVEEERARLGAGAVPVGMMVEVPSAALLAGAFAHDVDFFSIGTNDLTQYTLAMDRGHPKLAARVDGLDPAVLQLIARTVEASHAHGRWTGVCGGIASDPQAIPLLVGMGVDELSVSVPSLPLVKAQIREISRAASRTLADRALAAACAADVRELVPHDAGADELHGAAARSAEGSSTISAESPATDAQGGAP